MLPRCWLINNHCSMATHLFMCRLQNPIAAANAVSWTDRCCPQRTKDILHSIHGIKITFVTLSASKYVTGLESLLYHVQLVSVMNKTV